MVGIFDWLAKFLELTETLAKYNCQKRASKQRCLKEISVLKVWFYDDLQNNTQVTTSRIEK